MNKAIFIDRDGIFNRNYKTQEKIELTPEKYSLIDRKRTSKAVKMINDAGYLAIVVTNQPKVSKGFITFEQIDAIHIKLKELVDAKIDDIYYCPHHPEKGFEGEIVELKIDCDCRKPKPGMLLKAAKEHDIDLNNSWMIGDSKSDIVAGQKAGCKTVFVLGGGSGARHEQGLEATPDFVVKDLLEAVEKILGN